MSDVADLANDVMQERLDRLLAQRAQPLTVPSAFECDECGTDIPEARRLAVVGTQHCIDCASMLERKRFMSGGH